MPSRPPGQGRLVEAVGGSAGVPVSQHGAGLACRPPEEAVLPEGGLMAEFLGTIVDTGLGTTLDVAPIVAVLN